VPRSAPNISRVGRALWLLGVVTLGLSALHGVLRAYLYLVSVYPEATTRVVLVRDVRRVTGGALCLLAAAGLSSRREWGRRLARNTALTSSLFGLSSLALALRADADAPGVLMMTLGWFAAVAYECFWLSRPHIKAQFEADSAEHEKPLARRFAPLILAIAGVVALVTSNVEATARAPGTPAKSSSEQRRVR